MVRLLIDCEKTRFLQNKPKGKRKKKKEKRKKKKEKRKKKKKKKKGKKEKRAKEKQNHCFPSWVGLARSLTHKLYVKMSLDKSFIFK